MLGIVGARVERMREKERIDLWFRASGFISKALFINNVSLCNTMDRISCTFILLIG